MHKKGVLRKKYNINILYKLAAARHSYGLCLEPLLSELFSEPIVSVLRQTNIFIFSILELFFGRKSE